VAELKRQLGGKVVRILMFSTASPPWPNWSRFFADLATPARARVLNGITAVAELKLQLEPVDLL
jgi:hypothetical protein